MHDDLDAELGALLTGEIPLDSEEGQRLLAAANMTREEFLELQDLSAGLDEAARFHSEVAGQLDRLDPEAAEQAAWAKDQVERALGHAPREVPPDRPQPSRLRWLIPIAAALLFLPLALQLVNSRANTGDEIVLDRTSDELRIRIESDRGEFSTVHWSAEGLLAGDRLVLLVYPSEDLLRLEPLEEILITELSEAPESSPVTGVWSDPEAMRGWPDAVHLILEVRPFGQDARMGSWAEAKRDGSH